MFRILVLVNETKEYYYISIIQFFKVLEYKFPFLKKCIGQMIKEKVIIGKKKK